MSLKIKENNTTFFIEGSINASTANQFKNHMEFLILYKKELTINIDNVAAIDSSGMQVFRDLYKTAIANNKKFVVVGYGCKEIFQDFETSVAA
ncbi:STAS domain-containing protein [Hyunsoonleella sp. 2307UL5-6]|uniref:STAS domain-containing protein n=1 Tax=Hyunsoonleella sp. 2307UL5-6 TaxID=3384768 RepID=UPI0039BC8653